MRIEDTLAERCFDSLLPEAKENNCLTHILTNTFSTYNDNYSRVKIGMVAPHFSINSPSGAALQLNDFRGSYLLIDFWASWCGPCRENNPKLKSFYDKYKKLGLKVLSISVDTDKTKWKDAIVEDKMEWTHGSDLLGVNSGTSFNYHVVAVPEYFLIAPDGTILVKSIGGDINIIEDKLNKVMKQ
ncbi:MAG: TlpA disulfide reductase family protein [Ferruginibacter sp.]